MIYFIAMAWFVLLGIYFVVMLLKKSRVPGSKYMQRLPAVIMGGAVIFWTLYCFGFFRRSDLTVVDCLIIASLLESAVQSGLIPSNTNYRELFQTSTIAAQIVDAAYQPHFVSASAAALTEEQMKLAQEGPVKLGNTMLHAKPVTAGQVLWQDDVSQINKLMEFLGETQSRLEEQRGLLQAEVELKEKKAKAEEQNRLYDRIAREVTLQLGKAEELLLQVKSNPQQARVLMAKVCVLGSYIKRRGNLILLGEESSHIRTKELEFCIRESLDNLKLAGVFTALDCQCEGDALPDTIIAAYDFFEMLVERLLDDMTAMMVRLSCREGMVKMNLQAGCRKAITQNFLAEVSLPCCSFTWDVQEEDVIIDLTVDCQKTIPLRKEAGTDDELL